MDTIERTASTIAFLLPSFMAASLACAQAGQTADGVGPTSGLLSIGQGQLVGTTPYGGAHGFGTVYELTLTGSGYMETILYSFAGRNDGAYPSGALAADAAGTLYGTTITAGRGFECCGTVYSLTGNSGYTKATLYDFQGKKDGVGPVGRLLLDASGSIYGTTGSGGGKKAGMVFKLTKNGQGYAESVPYRFQGGDDGNEPQGSLIADQQGSLYGTTFVGGSADWGTAFQLRPVGSKYTDSILYSFTMQSGDGNRPNAALVADELGNLFGTTQDGALNGGIVFELVSTGSGFRESPIYTFPIGNSQCLRGCQPSGGLVRDSSGSLYGVTRYGGNDGCAGGFGCGVAYRLTPHGSGFVQTVLYVFQGGTDGASPAGEFVVDNSGALYGTTELGGGSGCGGYGCGTAYALIPSGKKYKEKIIHRFGS